MATQKPSRGGQRSRRLRWLAAAILMAAAAGIVSVGGGQMEALWSLASRPTPEPTSDRQQLVRLESALEAEVQRLFDAIEATGGLTQDAQNELRTMYLVMDLPTFLDQLPPWLASQGCPLTADEQRASEEAYQRWQELQQRYAAYGLDAESQPLATKGGAG